MYNDPKPIRAFKYLAQSLFEMMIFKHSKYMKTVYV